ncbi:MAG: hypothetical protein KGJ78_07575 [Alphaproteobacteria bacterium]|nr:hypothetical protein [Alphaproteobacteria bacterium]
MDQPDLDEQPRPRSHGCLWGCLGLFLVVALIIGGVFGYGTWYLYQGFEKDSRIAAIMQVVRTDARAEAVLGRNIHIVEIESHTFHYSSGAENDADYTLRLVGSDGEGKLTAHLDLNGRKPRIVVMVLTGKDGHPHALVGKAPESPMLQQSI